MGKRLEIAIVLAAATSAACGAPASTPPPTSNGDAPDAASSAPAVDASVPFASAPHLMLPIVDYNGGPILSAPEIVTVTFADDPMRDRLGAFADVVGHTGWWDEVRRGYCAAGGSPCVGQAKHVFHAVLPALTETQVSAGFEDDGYSPRTSFKDFLRGAINSGALPAPGPQTVYLVFPSEGVRVRQYDMLGCDEFTGYHSATTVEPPPGDGDAGTPAPPEFAYAVIPRCGTDEAAVTKAASHELIESATNPRDDDKGYDLQDAVWPGFLGGSEVADLCVGGVNGADDAFAEQGFTFQRSWSNDAVRAGREPCVPGPQDRLYFNTAPRADQIRTTIGVPVRMELDAFSEGPVEDWQVSAVDLLEAEGVGRFLQLAIDHPSVNNGAKPILTVTLISAPPPGSWIGAPLIVFSTVNGRAHFWPISVIGD